MIKKLKEGESYKYLGVDEDIEYKGSINKERELEKHYRHVKAIWTSELNARNKFIAHNTFAIESLIPTVGIIDWTIQEIEKIDLKPRRILCMAGNFHRKSDVNRLYVSRNEGGHGLKVFEDCFKTWIVSISRHLIRDRKRNHLLDNVLEHEKDRIMRIGKPYEKMYIEEEEEVKDKTISDKIKKEINKRDKDQWQAKQQHGHLFRKVAKKENTDHKGSYL